MITITIITITIIILIIISSSIMVESVDDDHRSEGHSGGLLAQHAIWGILDIFLWKTQQMPWIPFVVFSQEDIHSGFHTCSLQDMLCFPQEYIQGICCEFHELFWISS